MNTYLKSGVNIEAGNKVVDLIKPFTKLTDRSGVLGEIGAFGGLFNLSALSKSYSTPILVSSTDGVGTKLAIAQALDHHESIGIDLVAMCVNDILAQGAEPLFFLDYFATGSIDHNIIQSVIKGVANGCKEAQVALIGGETAEMPGMYSGNSYDLAGFAVGIVDYNEILPRSDSIKSGDVILGLSSTGLHSNGFSLIRQILKDLKIKYQDLSPWSNKTWGEILLEPTKIYVKSLLPVMHMIKGIAHITGGGFIDNIPRILPDSYAAQIELNSWERSEIFHWIIQEGKVSNDEMFKVFNCGIGMTIIVDNDYSIDLKNILEQNGEQVYIIGKIINKIKSKVEFI